MMNDAAPAGAKVDPAQIHAAGEFKYTAPLLAARFDPSGQFVFASAYDNTIQRWNLASGQATALVGHDSWVRTLAFHPSGSTLVSGGFDGRVIFWDATSEAPQATRTLEAHRGWVRAVAVSPDGKTLATAGNDNLVKLWSTADCSLVSECLGHANHVYSVAFHPDGTWLVSGDLKGVAIVWDLATGEELRRFDAAALWKYDAGFGADIGGVRAIAFNADGTRLACGGITEVSNAFAGIGNPLVVVFDFDSGNKLFSLASSKKLKAPVSGVRFHRDGFLVASCGGLDGGHLLFWKFEQADEFLDFSTGDVARDIDLHPDGLRLVTPHDDKTLRLWKMTAKAT
jgi:WD40 repeat protein